MSDDVNHRARDAKREEKLDFDYSLQLDELIKRAEGKLAESDLLLLRQTADRLAGFFKRRCPQCGFEM